MIRMPHPAWARRVRRHARDDAIMERLASAMASVDVSAVRAILHRAVVLTIDSGGYAPIVSEPLEGRAAAASVLAGLMRPGTTAATASINSVRGVVLTRDQMVVGAVTAETRSGTLCSVWVVCNPEKLRHWNR